MTYKRAIYWEGVTDLIFLKTLLKDDFELKPESSALASKLKCVLDSALCMNSSTRYLFTKS